ncbi:MAG TPA: hypothetical protein DCR56_06310 [Flavobacteriaceae bacterium]|jgi:hypothetical protein|nr:hypothetical protein [Flavobacteriaceae bacterium]NQV62557.1 hypothetical protein [Cryomorphaceae bacterium]MBT5922050.1 hypothetical protein [Flavobacteriaceae bacterium]MCO4853193.1 hypothetical protein [Flavobacteriaceae bacterium]MDA8931439.1 DUF6155 family protein [Flavobacteriaceae bacterium]|tara:strand:- start:21029 stop:21535 length:507 start_codon:yes stop_codon:yes gene_type:complete
MSKKLLQKHLVELQKEHLEIMVLDLYDKFPEVKTYFNFVFNPNENKLLEQARVKVANEFFPLKRKRPKARRSVAQKYIKHFKTLGMSPELIAEFMWYNIGLMHTFCEEKPQRLPFFKSFCNFYKEALQFASYHQIIPLYKTQILAVYTASKDWENAYDFEMSLQTIED